MKIGIVGAEGSKFTAEGERQARLLILDLLLPAGSVLVSGHCHLGGIDIWAEEIADGLGIEKKIFPPTKLQWEGGYKQRNLLIAWQSDIVHCIAVDRLPSTFSGMRHSSCYHCGTTDHVKSGGCWTMKKAKAGKLHIIKNNPEE